MNKKIVCYTCCTGGYDNISQYEVINPNWDYVYFTDNEELIKQKRIGHWEIRPLAFSKLTNVKNARWHKVNAHVLFPEYEYSLWLDANITIKSENVINKIRQLIKEDTLFSVPLHPNRSCIYDEAKVIIDLDIDYKEIVNSEIKFLKKEKYPTTNGLHETCILFRKHNQLKNTLDLWWKMIKKYSKRDQLSFDYAIWKNNISVLPLYEKGTEHRTNGDFLFFNGKQHDRKKFSTPLAWYKKKIFSKESIINKDGIKTKQYNFFGLSVLKKIKKPTQKKIKLFGITIYKKIKKPTQKKLKLFGITICKKIKKPTQKKLKLFGITIYKKIKKINGRRQIYFCGIKIFSYKKKKKEKTKSESKVLKSVFFKELIPYIVKKSEYNPQVIEQATILIPVYNGLLHLEKLIPSLLEHTSPDVKIIIIDDCSPDPNISKFLQKYNSLKQIKIIKNNKNLGFVQTINKGMKCVQTKYAIWLNSDTIVPEKWLERLLQPFQQFDKIASTTPFTNSGTAYSYPIFGKDNKLFTSLEEIDGIFQQISASDLTLNQSHSGCGFCMAINMDCWKEIGTLDEENFGKGYGEENDWCFRALQKGWKNLLVPNLFVQHCHGGSFLTEEKKELGRKHQQILKNKYPDIMKNNVPLFFKTDPWKIYRMAANFLYCQKKETILFMDFEHNHDNTYWNERIAKYADSNRCPILLLFKDKKLIESSLHFPTIDTTVEIKLNDIKDLSLLFELIHFSEIISHISINFNDFNKKLKKSIKQQSLFVKMFTIKKERKLSPIEHIRSLGVKVGENFHPIIHPHPWSYPDFGSEPFLIEIGDDVCISFGCTFLTHDATVHVCEKLSSHPADKIFKYGRIKIGNNVFIGCKSIILPNVTIGNNCVVGAGSVVTKSIPDNEVWAGNPARFISKIEDFSKKSYALYNTIEQQELREIVFNMRKK